MRRHSSTAASGSLKAVLAPVHFAMPEYHLSSFAGSVPFRLGRQRGMGVHLHPHLLLSDKGRLPHFTAGWPSCRHISHY